MMGDDRSLEQISETYSRQIHENRYKILDDFYHAYVAYVGDRMGYPIDLQSIRLIEEDISTDGKLQTCWRWEYCPQEDIRDVRFLENHNDIFLNPNDRDFPSNPDLED